MNRKCLTTFPETLIVLSLLSGCNDSAGQVPPPQPKITLDTLPDSKSFSTMPVDEVQTIYSFLYNIPLDETVDYIAQAFRESAEGQSEFAFHSNKSGGQNKQETFEYEL